VVLEPKRFASQESYSEAIFDHCRHAKVDLVVMAGFLKRVTIPADFVHRVVNIHPALIPAFCGEGFYGHRVHEAVLEYGAKLSGCTVHFADNQYDHGPVILQRAVPVLDGDTPEALAARVFEAECEAYPEALRLLASGRVAVEGRRVRIKPSPDPQTTASPPALPPRCR
jgi:folate-dependent phosphoribosylglycinamide formyltransferase PurN